MIKTNRENLSGAVFDSIKCCICSVPFRSVPFRSVPLR